MIGNILGNVVGFLLMLGVPLAACIYYLWKRDGRIWMFFAGILSFTVSQLLIRIPLLQYAGKKWEWLMLLPYTSLVLYYGFLGLTAGLFEETGRWAAFSLMKRRRRALDWKDALALGLGHGGVEAVWVAVSGLLAVVSMACVLKMKSTAFVSKRLSEKFGKLWIAAEVILFVLVGAAVDIRYTLQAGAAALAMILLALVFRACGVLLCVAKTSLGGKEKLFCVIAYLPKATVQAAIGSVPLAAGLSCGQIVLSVAVLAIVITAPLGALGMDATYKKLLEKES